MKFDANTKIGELMVSYGYMSFDQRDAVLHKQQSSHELFGDIAVQMQLISEECLNNILSQIFSIDYIDLDFVSIPAAASSMLPHSLLSECLAIPFRIDQQDIPECVHIAIADPGNIIALDKIKHALYQNKVKFHLSAKSKIEKKLSLLRGGSLLMFDPITFLNDILCIAIDKYASDLHFEPMRNDVVVRLRIDGVLHQLKVFDYSIWPKIRSRLKIIANLNIAETRKPQSGHTKIKISEKLVDLRISTHPSIFGESIAIRILDSEVGIRDLNSLGFQIDDVKYLMNAVKKPNGIFLISGPTGSGKTSTLYSLLKEINTGLLNIMTLEDPVEYQIEGVRQLDIQDEGIISFSDGIRSMLRQDPDVILVGEVRDECTASAILRASLTGRLVLTTIHASNPREALQRLINLGIDMHEFATQLIGIFSQRLLRRKVLDSYSGRFPVAEYFLSVDSVKHQIASMDINIKLNKTFQDSITYAIENNFTDVSEVQRVFGYGYI